MRPTEITKNVVDISDMYDPATALWWLNLDKLPSILELRTFTTKKDDWEKWINDNVDVKFTLHRIRPNESNLSLKSCSGWLNGFQNVVVGWSASVTSKESIEISNLVFKYSREYDQKFDSTWVDESLNKLKIVEDRKSKIYMVIQTRMGLELQDFDINVPTMDIEMNYGEEWAQKHEQLKEILSMKKKKGIALLHGLPGTGKSMYIRHLISSMAEDKTVVYLPNQLIPSITDPGFIPLMAEYAGSILVIEDADEAIKARKDGGNTVDKLLNLADGILSDFLNMQIICTFNSDITTIDEALLRKGRLILKHKFDKLSKE